jgi:hypothetical protein
LVRALRNRVPQAYDIIEFREELDQMAEMISTIHEFEHLIVNTEATRPLLEEMGWDSGTATVIPHHHCNVDGFVLPAGRLEKPRVVGYLGESRNLHDADAIEAAVRKMGMEFRAYGATDLGGYAEIDIGVAWTRRATLRDATRSGIKLINYCSYGIPSVVANYQSYRDVDFALGGGAAVVASDLDELLAGIWMVAENGFLRHSLHERCLPALELYGRDTIACFYRDLFVILKSERDVSEGSPQPEARWVR